MISPSLHTSAPTARFATPSSSGGHGPSSPKGCARSARPSFNTVSPRLTGRAGARRTFDRLPPSGGGLAVNQRDLLRRGPGRGVSFRRSAYVIRARPPGSFGWVLSHSGRGLLSRVDGGAMAVVAHHDLGTAPVKPILGRSHVLISVAGIEPYGNVGDEWLGHQVEPSQIR